MKKLIIALILIIGSIGYAERIKFVAHKVNDTDTATNDTVVVIYSASDTADFQLLYGTDLAGLMGILTTNIGVKAKDIKEMNEILIGTAQVQQNAQTNTAPQAEFLP